jgi:NADPH-dependent 2,4-dienoyl-CoA reductase/sulfur reductase-like enzyme
VSDHVLVVGGGFAGVGCVKRLAAAEHGVVHVTLIDRHNYHQFQPLLYQVASSQLAPSDVAFSLRAQFHDCPNVDVKLADIASIDPATRTVTATDGESWTGEALVIAAGSQPNSSRRQARASTRSRCTRSTTPRCCDPGSSGPLRTPTATRRGSTRAPSTSWWSAAAPPVSRWPGRSRT